MAWGLFPAITRFEVVAVITNAVATEGIDALPEGAMKPRIVADHGSANIAAYTRKNIEVQGLDLWLSGIGRPTGNARTERVIGTLKREEIKLQEQYENERRRTRASGRRSGITTSAAPTRATEASRRTQFIFREGGL